jgi:transcriptional regulator with XRE-family HTH domain
MKSAYVKINAEAIRRHCVANGYTMADLARRMGRTQSYFSNCLSRGSISASAYPLLVSVAGVNPDAFLARETPPKTEVSPAPPPARRAVQSHSADKAGSHPSRPLRWRQGDLLRVEQAARVVRAGSGTGDLLRRPPDLQILRAAHTRDGGQVNAQ